MKKLLLVALVVAGLYWCGTHSLSEQSGSAKESPPNVQSTETAEKNNESGILDSGLKKLSVLGTWHVKKIESDGVIVEIPDNECPMAFHFNVGGDGTSIAGEDACDISWSENNGIVYVKMLLGGEDDFIIPLLYDDNALIWDTDDSVIYFLK